MISGNPGSSTHVSIFDLQYSILYAQYFVFYLFACTLVELIVHYSVRLLQQSLPVLAKSKTFLLYFSRKPSFLIGFRPPGGWLIRWQTYTWVRQRGPRDIHCTVLYCFSNFLLHLFTYHGLRRCKVDQAFSEFALAEPPSPPPQLIQAKPLPTSMPNKR